MMLLGACNNSDENPEPDPIPDERDVLISSELVFSATSLQIKFLALLSGLALDVNEFKYDVDIYTVSYRTLYKASEITASGLVVLPKTTQEVGMVSYQHGTIVTQDDAPSNFSETDPNAFLYGSLSSSGFITAIPDYIGFGTSSAILHPYYVEEYTASAVIDIIKAARELAIQKDIKFNNNLFLAGYSEGGYATMAAHKAIEKDGLDDFTLIASFPAAGAYDVKGMQEYLFAQETYGSPYYLAYVARAYQTTYEFPSILADFFQEPYASRIPQLFDGQKSASEINAQLTTSLGDLLQEDVSVKLNTYPSYAYLKEAFEINSLTDWIPAIPMYMYHGESDMTVPYQNSVDTYTILLENGASTEIISLIPLEGTHSSAATPYVLDFVSKLWELR